MIPVLSGKIQLRALCKSWRPLRELVDASVQPLKTREGLIAIKLSSRILSQARVIAKGRRIRNVQRLVAQYGGRASQWVKKSSAQFKAAGECFEYHWYEHPGIGRFETKQVRVK